MNTFVAPLGKISSPLRPSCWVPTLLAAAALSLSSASAAIINDFSGGNGTSSSNQYAGAAGDGWAGPWSATTVGSGITLSPTVVNTTPFPGQSAGTNYLSVPITRANASTRQAAISRTYQNAGAVQLTSDHQIELVFRINSVSNLSAANTSFTIADTLANLSENIAPTTASMAWGLFALGDVGYTPKELMFRGINLETQTQVFQKTNILLQDNTVYKLTIAIHAADKTYTGTLEDLTNDKTYTGTFGFAASQTAVSGRLAIIYRDNQSSGMNYDLQSVTVIPEAPTAAYLLPGALALLGTARWRRGRRLS